MSSLIHQWRRCIVVVVCLSASSYCAAGGDDSLGRDDTNMLPHLQGVWRGQLENFPIVNDEPLPIVEFVVDAGEDPQDGCLTWRSSYSIDGVIRQVQDYKLCRGGTDRYYVDEGNDVVLEASVFGGEVYSAFEAGGITLFTHWRADGDRLIRDIYFATESVIPVEGLKSFIGSGLQKIEFRRIR